VKLLVVDDDRDLVELLDYALRREGYEVVRAYDGEAALETLNREHPDLVVLDINLPKLAGFVVLERIRHVDEHVPVLLLSARQDESDILRGLQLGADDYITKPFSIREFRSRVRALLRRARTLPGAGESAAELIEHEGLVIDVPRRQVTVRGENVQLTYVEFELLRTLAATPGRVFSRRMLLEALWKSADYRDPRTIDVHVRHLREKLEAEPRTPEYILTVRGVGYRFRDR
jgi:DNA-binding response OmpR family regulator